MADVPHLSIPLRVTPSGGLAVNEQDGIDDVTQCVRVLLATQAGSRIDSVEYGIHDPTFAVSRSGQLDTADLEAAVAEWEPRAEVDFDSLVGVLGSQGDVRDRETTAAILAAVTLT